MIVTPVKTRKILPSKQSLLKILDESIDNFSEKSVLAITSKIVSLCENRAIPTSKANKETLIKQEADYYMPARMSKYEGFQFTITENTLIPDSGIDESNTNGNYLLWPKDSQQTANDVRTYLCKRFDLSDVGVIITDSTCVPLRWGTLGIPMAYSGFAPNNNYIGTEDLFGRPFKVSMSNVAGGLAAAAVVVMGEGREQTPMAVIEDLPFVRFQDHNPTEEELKKFYIPYYKDDLFAPFLESVEWKKGGRKSGGDKS